MDEKQIFIIFTQHCKHHKHQKVDTYAENDQSCWYECNTGIMHLWRECTIGNCPIIKKLTSQTLITRPLHISSAPHT